MKAELIRAPVADVVVSHMGETVRFSISYWEKSTGGTFGKEDDDITLEPFNEINRYWSNLSIDTQTHIFMIYKKMREVLDNEYELERLQSAMTGLFSGLMQFHSYDDIQFFTKLNVLIKMPSDIDAVFDPESTSVIGTPERTYIQSDYKDLIVLSIALRPLGIVWGEYIKHVEKPVSNIWKELNAFYLLQDTWVLDSKPMKRLEVYVEANVRARISDPDFNIAPAIIAGIGTEDYPRWLLGLTLLRKVVFADITGREDRSNIVQSIYGYIQSKLNNTSSSFKLNIQTKTLRTDIDGEDAKLSVLESYRSKEDIPSGDVAIIEHALMHPVELAKEVDYDIDPRLVQEAIDSSHDLLQRMLTSGQIIVAQWVLSTVLPIRIMPHLEKTFVIRALAITEAVLWHRGYKSIAALVSAYPLPNDNDMITLPRDPVPVPRDLTEKMDSYYPFARKTSGRSSKKKPKPGTIALMNVCRKFAEHDWYLTLPGTWLPDVNGVRSNRKYTAQPDLKLRMTELIIDINERIKNELPIIASGDADALSR